MSSAVALLTYQRLEVLIKTLDTLVEHTQPSVPIAIFDDGSRRDNTVEWLRAQSTQPVLECSLKNLLDKIECEGFTTYYKDRPIEVYAAKHNLGVAANSNRAIKWFGMMVGYDHLFLANDDLVFHGDAVSAYAKAHKDLEIGLLCLNNLKDDAHRWLTTNCRGYKLKIFRMMTGAVMSMTKSLIDDIGYFDVSFGRFGEEHCDFTNRARIKGFMQVLGKPQICIDIDFTPPVLDHQHDVESSVVGVEKETCDAAASKAMSDKQAEYRVGIFYNPFRLRHTPFVNRHAGFDSGIKAKNMLGVEETPALIVPFE